MGGRGSGRRRKEFFVPDPDYAAYERQSKESDPAWEAFQIYRGLGLDRTLAQVAKTLEKSPTLIGKWSGDWGWRQRVEAWDREVDRKTRQAELKAIGEMRKRHVKMAVSLQGLGATELQKWLSFVRKAENTANRSLSPDQLLKLIEAGIKLERLNRGEPNEIVEERKGMDDEQVEARIEQLLKAYGK